LNDCAGELGTSCPGEWRLVLVFALDLQDIEEVLGGGVVGDEVFVGFRGGVGEGGDFELVGGLFEEDGLAVGLGIAIGRGKYGDVFFDLNAAHFDRLTVIYWL